MSSRVSDVTVADVAAEVMDYGRTRQEKDLHKRQP